MSKTYETGQVKALANFEAIIAFVQGYGAVYNPTTTAIQLQNLQAKAQSVKTELGKLNVALANEAKAIAIRNEAFLPLKKLSTRLFNALKAVDGSTNLAESFSTLHRKMQGRRATAKLSNEEVAEQLTLGKVVKQISAAQQSYDSILDTFDKQIALLATVPAYQPNEIELQLATLQAQYAKLQAANAEVVALTTAAGNQRLTRNDAMYHPETGMTALVAKVKSYVSSVFGTTSAQYKQISSFSFKPIKS